MMTVDHLSELLLKHLQGSLSSSGQARLAEWVTQSESNRRLFESVNDEVQLRQLLLQFQPDADAENEAVILSKISLETSRTIAPVRSIGSIRKWGLIAASVLILAGVGSYWWINGRTEVAEVVEKQPFDVPPGKEGAVLTLADGRMVVLDSLANGVIATQNGAQVMLHDGQLAYALSNGVAAVYNTLATPKGRQFQLILPDGTKVWLNAASSLRYPTAFSGERREVEVTGEVYFEIAENHRMPFTVNVDNRVDVQVLGTHFNINAYSNENVIRTTLLEGKIKVIGKNAAALLKPGQEAQINKADGIKVLDDADLDKAIAWKSGFFNFDNVHIGEVMRQIERWYDIEVVYEKDIPNIWFGGKLSNDLNLAGLLKSLKDSEVRYRLEGRKLIVLP